MYNNNNNSASARARVSEPEPNRCRTNAGTSAQIPYQDLSTFTYCLIGPPDERLEHPVCYGLRITDCGLRITSVQVYQNDSLRWAVAQWASPTKVPFYLVHYLVPSTLPCKTPLTPLATRHSPLATNGTH